jgi:hypothetical protein
MGQHDWRIGLLAIIASVSISGCLPEEAALAPSAPAETPPNVAPTIAGNPSLVATAGQAWQFQPVATDADGDTLSFSAAGLPAWLAINSQTGLVSGTPGDMHVGLTPAIVITVSDGEASTSLQAFAIDVGALAPPAQPEPPTEPEPTPPPPPPANTAPGISGSPATSVQATTAYTFVPVATDADMPAQRLTFAITGRPTWASFSTTTGALTGTPSAGQVGVYSNIRISVSDGQASTSLPAFSITVTAAPNRAPTISGTPGSSATVGTQYSFQPSATDPDGQTLTYAISNRPAWASFSSSTGRLSGTPAAEHVGTTTGIVITVSDGTASASLPAFAITVNAAPNRAPTISGSPATSVTVGMAYSFAPTASDPDGDALTWSISGKPGTAMFNVSTGQLTWTPSTAGTWTNILITVTDSRGASASLPAFSITVNPAAPTGTAALSWQAPTQYTDGTALPGNELDAYRIYGGTSAGSLNPIAEVDSGTMNFTVQALPSGTHYFAVTAVSDSGVESAMSEVGSKTIP